MKVTYLEHSGFAAEYKEYVLIFDWYRGSLPEFDQQKKIYVFASHSHYDHFNKKIFGKKQKAIMNRCVRIIRGRLTS